MAGEKLSLRDIIVRRRDREILRLAAMDVMEGEVLAVIGPNGAGKSTLLQVLGLLLRPARGEVLFEGQPVRRWELSLRRRMAVMLQEPLLLRRSVAENVEMGMSLRGVPRGERKARVERWLRRFGVAHLAERSARKLSGGEAHRVSLARAFALEPEVLLLDEPFSALDQPTREALLEELAEALRETGVTTVFVTHDRNEALRLGARVAVIVKGELRQIGPTTEVFAAPADEDVAALVGAETVVAGRHMSEDGGLSRVQVGPHVVQGVSNGRLPDDVLVVVRPEDVTLFPAGDLSVAGSARNRFHGKIVSVTPSGRQARVVIDCGFPLVALVTKQSVDELDIRKGREVVAAFKAHSVHFIPRR
ncbi:MAG: ABC transporter ATP-binding protein [Dehalococcoidia bacterium]|nr:ABC transporter ATP-binding protein [Dehalococcoidia bacterium]